MVGLHSGSYCLTRSWGLSKPERRTSETSHKVSVFSMYPTSADGPVSTDKPSAAPDLRLILGGKFLDNSETLNGASTFSQLQHLVLSK